MQNQIPHGWIDCPNTSNELILNKFITFKVPLGNNFTIDKLLEYIKQTYNTKLGLIIDLTNTTKYYDSNYLKPLHIKYMKIFNKGYGSAPSQEIVNLFIRVINSFIKKNSTDLIGVHCTHGYNRTGFLLCAYMIEELDYATNTAIEIFADARPPGIYKKEYIEELYKRYPCDTIVNIPQLPTWKQ